MPKEILTIEKIKKAIKKCQKSINAITMAPAQARNFFLRCANETPVQMIFLMSLAEH